MKKRRLARFKTIFLQVGFCSNRSCFRHKTERAAPKPSAPVLKFYVLISVFAPPTVFAALYNSPGIHADCPDGFDCRLRLLISRLFEQRIDVRERIMIVHGGEVAPVIRYICDRSAEWHIPEVFGKRVARHGYDDRIARYTFIT